MRLFRVPFTPITPLYFKLRSFIHPNIYRGTTIRGPLTDPSLSLSNAALIPWSPPSATSISGIWMRLWWSSFSSQMHRPSPTGGASWKDLIGTEWAITPSKGGLGTATKPTRCDLLLSPCSCCIVWASKVAVGRPTASSANRSFPFVMPLIMVIALSGSIRSTKRSAPYFNMRSPLRAKSTTAMTLSPANFASWIAQQAEAEDPRTC